MSGAPSCASTEPSAMRTMECTTLCGCMSTPRRSAGRPNSQAASMSSSPLFIMVAESTLILRPIDQFGCATASAGVASATVPAARFRNGPPDAVRMICATPASAPRVSPQRNPAGMH